MANLNKGYKRFVAIGCSHGALADPAALKAVLGFCGRFKPHTRVHLGDFLDMAAFRSGAKGTHDEAVSISDDLVHGLNFLREYRPTKLLNGNHEIRLWKDADHHNEILARAAQSVIVEIRTLANKLKCEYLESYNINKSWLTLGDYRLIHGWLFSENALRDHVEHFGNLIMAHLHTPGQVAGRRVDNPRGFCAGTLADIEKMTYAHQRRATARWAPGLVYGEYSDTECFPHLTQCEPGGANNWRFPL